jgi:hypothetical protein
VYAWAEVYARLPAAIAERLVVPEVVGGGSSYAVSHYADLHMNVLDREVVACLMNPMTAAPVRGGHITYRASTVCPRQRACGAQLAASLRHPEISTHASDVAMCLDASALMK